YDAKDGNWIFFLNFSAAEANITVFDDRLDLQIIDRKSGVISTSFFPADFQYPSMQIQVAYSGATNIVSLKCRPRKN
ncbi:MAG: hypothetical protein KDD40_13245, partial [Bdellovibrionales bacterium]|nr:hypothetical protein [Bdellovibrionales bacterium]